MSSGVFDHEHMPPVVSEGDYSSDEQDLLSRAANLLHVFWSNPTEYNQRLLAAATSWYASTAGVGQNDAVRQTTHTALMYGDIR